MKAKWFLIRWVFAALFLLATDCTPRPETVTPQPAVQAVESTRVNQPASTPTPDVQAQKRQVLKEKMEKCAAVQPGYACLVEGPVVVKAQPDRWLRPFQSAGDMIRLADLERLKLGKPGSGDGLVWLSIPADTPGAGITVMAFGDVELTNNVTYGSWEFAAMQSLSMTAGPADNFEQAAARGLIVQAPHDGTLNTLVINGVEMVFGSTAFITSQGGMMKVNTYAGAVAVNLPDMPQMVEQGTTFSYPLDPLASPTDPARPLTPEEMEILTDSFDIMVLQDAEPYDEEMKKKLAELYRRYYESKKRQQPWKSGWWKMTYGPATISGDCLTKAVAAGDGGGGGYGEPYSVEIPICRANNGRTLLYDYNGLRFDRLGPNLYVTGWLSERQDYGSTDYVTSARFESLQVLSPTRMKLNKVNAEAGGCTTTHSIFLDFLREDPAIRCGYVEDNLPDETPEPVASVEPPLPPPPPVEGDYTVRLGFIPNDCTAQAKDALPEFLQAGSSAGIRLKAVQESALLMETHAGSYLLALGPAFDFSSDRVSGHGPRLGMYALEEPLDETYTLSMSLFEISAEQFGGSWHIYSQDGEQYCSGSLDLLAQK